MYNVYYHETDHKQFSQTWQQSINIEFFEKLCTLSINKQWAPRLNFLCVVTCSTRLLLLSVTSRCIALCYCIFATPLQLVTSRSKTQKSGSWARFSEINFLTHFVNHVLSASSWLTFFIGHLTSPVSSSPLLPSIIPSLIHSNFKTFLSQILPFIPPYLAPPQSDSMAIQTCSVF